MYTSWILENRKPATVIRHSWPVSRRGLPSSLLRAGRERRARVSRLTHGKRKPSSVEYHYAIFAPLTLWDAIKGRVSRHRSPRSRVQHCWYPGRIRVQTKRGGRIVQYRFCTQQSCHRYFALFMSTPCSHFPLVPFQFVDETCSTANIAARWTDIRINSSSMMRIILIISKVISKSMN